MYIWYLKLFYLLIFIFKRSLKRNFSDLSRVKIFKKLPFRYLEIQKRNDDCSLKLVDKSTTISSKTPNEINCLTSENTKSMYNWLLQQICLTNK